MRHTARAYAVAPDSHLVLVNERPVYQTPHAETAEGMAARLERIFADEGRDLSQIACWRDQGRYLIFCPPIRVGEAQQTTTPERVAELFAWRDAAEEVQTAILEIDPRSTEDPWTEAEVVIENLQRALSSGQAG